MALVDDLRVKLNTTSKDAADMAKNVAAQTRLRAQIMAEERKLRGLYADLGKAYYEDPDDESIEVYKDSIAAVKDIISDYQNELVGLKGQRVCVNCGAIIPKTALFCSHCGARNDIVEEEPVPEEEPQVRTCPVCNAVVTEDMAFCEVCGAKLED